MLATSAVGDCEHRWLPGGRQGASGHSEVLRRWTNLHHLTAATGVGSSASQRGYPQVGRRARFACRASTSCGSCAASAAGGGFACG